MSLITREQFMEFFRSEEFHNLMTPDDCAEIFTGVLHGSSDIEEELFQEVADRYYTGITVKFYESSQDGNLDKHKIYPLTPDQSFTKNT